MANWRVIETDSGSYCGDLHLHNGYYAGDFNRMTSPGGTPTPAVGASVPPIAPHERIPV